MTDTQHTPVALPPEARERAERATRIPTDFDGGQMIWYRWGSGPPIVLLHGGHGSWTHWLRNIETLARHHSVIIPDMPGFGESDHLPQPSIETHCRALLNGLAALGVDGSMHLAAFSFGGTPAGYMLSALGKRVRRLFLVGSWEFGSYHELGNLFQRWRDAPPGPERDAVQRHNLSVLMLKDPDTIDALAIRLQAYNTDRARTGTGAILQGTDLLSALRNASCPVTFIYGEEDALVRGHLEERRSRLREMQQGSAFHVVPDAGHWVQYEAPDVFNRLILEATARDP